ncbi:uncharacterized protein Fot_54576 [Forsythia ovata]|uniref:Uncharacterized protein n=1 Tax=Forsythia ovata TaxID=205694 RepID=A0ABD1P7Y8_9LAMI
MEDLANSEFTNTKSTGSGNLSQVQVFERFTQFTLQSVTGTRENSMEKAEYAKFRNRDVREIYHRYPQLFGQAFDSDKYAMTPTKLSQRGFDGVINSGSDSPHDTLPIFAETRDSSDEVEHLASVGEALAASRQNSQDDVPSCRQCINELVATGKVPKGSAIYNFALTFLVNRKNREGFAAAEEPEYKLGWIQYNFDQLHK